jgi:hypothetical protein
MELTYTFYVEVDMPAGPGADEVKVNRWFDTDDTDQAFELAERFWPEVKPARYIEGTLRIT